MRNDPRFRLPIMFVAVLLLQTTLLARMRLFGVMPDLMLLVAVDHPFTQHRTDQRVERHAGHAGGAGGEHRDVPGGAQHARVGDSNPVADQGEDQRRQRGRRDALRVDRFGAG